jgi:signal recognition particle receptor subunit beta
MGRACMQGVTRRVQLVDVPGHPRMRGLVRERCKAAAVVIFVLDSAAFIQQKADVAGSDSWTIQL